MSTTPASAPTTVPEMRAWLHDWVARTTDTDPADIADDRPLEESGLSSRDVVVLSGDLERLLGVTLDATVAYEYNTVDSLASYVMARVSGTSGSDRVPGPQAASAAGAWQDPSDRQVAVVGMAARYPGAESVSQMWKLFEQGRSGVGDLPEGRWSEYDGDPEMVRRMSAAQLTGGYLDDIASFDAEFFGLSPVEAASMDPQQRILLQLTWEALEDAHIPANTLRGTRTGVFIGTTNNDYGMLISADPTAAHPYALTGNSTAVVANRISYAFDFRGPSVAIDTACSSSLVAVHDAVAALRTGEATLAVAGGVNILANPFGTVAFSELGVLSPTGGIRAFSEDADGIVRSDGAGVLVLKRLSDARRDGDDILAVIAGTAVTQDGRSNGLTAPNPEAQVAVLQQAYGDAGIDPRTVDYVEAHGTGTILGDPIEAGALGRVLGEGRDNSSPLLLGSAKTNFGHTEAAAGVAGVIKVVESMRHGVLPRSLNFTGPNPYIDFDRDHLEVVEDPREWPAYSGHPVAGVSGFGFGGTNAHVVVVAPEGAAPDPDPEAREDRPALFDRSATQTVDDGDGGKSELGIPQLLPVSGLLPSRRRTAASDLADWLGGHDGNDGHNAGAGQSLLTDTARTLGRRSHGRSRGVVLAHGLDEASAGVARLAAGKKGAGVAAADSPDRMGAVWVYSGFGSQHRKMGKELFTLSPLFAARVREIAEVVAAESGWDLVELVTDDARDYDLETAQVGITAIQIALTDLMTAAGARPSAVVGQSMGEIAAAYAVGGLSMQDAVRVACHRARLMGEGERLLPEDKLGAMAVIDLGVEELASFQQEHPEFSAVEPAVYAAPGMTTVGGPARQVADLVAFVDGEGRFARQLQVKGAGHTSMLDPVLGELHAEICDITARPITVPLYSTVDRGVVYRPGDTPHDADYFVRCTRQPVWFSDATGSQFDAGFRTFVEFSPNPVALMPLMNTAFARDAGDASLMFLLKRKHPAADTFLTTVAELYVRGADIDFTALAGPGGWADLPGMHWNLQRHWTDARPGGGAVRGMPGARVALPDGRTAFSAALSDVTSVSAVAEAAVHAVDGDAVVSAVESYGALAGAPGDDVTTVVQRSLGGLTVHVHHIAADGSARLVGEAFATASGSAATPQGGGAAAPAVSAGAAGGAAPVSDRSATGKGAVNALPAVDPSSERWDPESGESVADRLRAIVSESMGYDADDLPGELPLIDLGLDSLMGMRIKNRVEYDFGLPPLNVQELRDGSVDSVIAMVESLVADGGSTGEDAAVTAASDTSAGTTDASGTPDASVAQAQAPTGVGVAPRDAAERMVFGTWASVTGAAPAGVTSPLPPIDTATAETIAARINERSGSSITAQQVMEAGTVEPLSDIAREFLETEVEGNIRVLRERPAGSRRPAVFMFHPAGGSSVVYEPLTRRLPDDVPVYGVERLEGSLDERARAYVEDITALADGLPVVLGGWSFGGALAYEVAHRLENSEVTVGHLELLDLVQPLHPAPDTKEEMHARWDRYSAFASKTYGIDLPVPHDLLDEQGEEALIGLMTTFLRTSDSSGHGLAAGVLEHQRASFVDTRILNTLDFHRWADVTAPVTLYKSEGMHEGAIELEPSFAEIAPDGGWGGIVDDLEIVHLPGDHLGVPDEPAIGIVGARITEHLDTLS